ncbi:hypothetical protein VKT23_017288 [Stygiomarasmius scandens]|uniref:Heterokaryon incompatibility domain-containing protein n=1 Tax=Marasmiellus scandens TaxID=2682957 RepID=A0ABR1IUQ1_9AGAR
MGIPSLSSILADWRKTISSLYSNSSRSLQEPQPRSPDDNDNDIKRQEDSFSDTFSAYLTHRKVYNDVERQEDSFSDTSSAYLTHRKVYKGFTTKSPTSPDLMAPINICPRRLIDTNTLELVEFGEDKPIPSYAILSHRWISGEEVVHNEFIHLQEETKKTSGYLKIEAACEQACEDGIRYIWIDTCCIKQGNHADVKTNITSMYAYYQNAEVCYAYLVDVPGIRDSVDASKWFERGWTLQELLAPRTVIFFDRDWQRIGDKDELQDEIYRETTIPPAVLSGEKSIQDIDVLTRMSWSMRRRTTKRQDEAYCLQGLLGIVVEPDYTEDPYTSFSRLGKALFDARPELKERLGISDDYFNDHTNSLAFWDLLNSRFWDTQYRLSKKTRLSIDELTADKYPV